MPKDYTANRITDIQFHINLGVSTPDNKHYAALLECRGKARNGTMEANIEIEPQYLGQEKDVPWTPHEIWQAIGSANLSNIFKNAIRDLYQEGLNEDITQ